MSERALVERCLVEAASEAMRGIANRVIEEEVRRQVTLWQAWAARHPLWAKIVGHRFCPQFIATRVCERIWWPR